MLFREKSAWITLITTLVVWVPYFWLISDDLLAGRPLGREAMGLFIGGVIVLTVLQSGLAIVAAISSGKTFDKPMDEREQLIDMKATRPAFHVMSAVAVGVAFVGWLLGLNGQTMANGILLALVVSEIVRSAGKVVRYRTGG